MRSQRSSEFDDLGAEIARLSALPLAALRTEWRTRFGTAPPCYRTQELVAHALAHRLQAHAWGDLRKSAKRELEKLADQFSVDGTAAPDPVRHVRSGAVLVRIWNGERHEVEALDSGFAYRGRRYTSLSAVARAITGVRWNGPRFFAVKAARAR